MRFLNGVTSRENGLPQRLEGIYQEGSEDDELGRRTTGRLLLRLPDFNTVEAPDSRWIKDMFGFNLRVHAVPLRVNAPIRERWQ